MRVVISCPAEARVVEDRLRAMAQCLGPLVELEVLLPDGRELRMLRGGSSPAAQCASLNEWMEDHLRRRDQDSRGSR